MKKNILKITLFLLCNFVLVGLTYPADLAYKTAEKTYILKVTSKDPNKVVNFSGSYMKFSNKEGTGSWQMRNSTTPFETTLTANFVGAMFSSIESPITVTILEKAKDGDHLKLSATGLFTFAHTDTYGTSYATGSGGL
jgi:hypothetical protein